MFRRSTFLCAGVIVAAAGPVMALEIEADVAAYLHNGKIRTHGYSHDTGQFIVDPHGDFRVFAYNFDEGFSAPPQVFLEHPGFNAEGFEDEFGTPTGFAPGSHIGIVVQSAIKYWNGNGAAVFGAADANASITLDNFGISRLVTAASFDDTPFFIFEVEDAPDLGAYHGHISSILNDDSVPAGIYSIEAIVVNGQLTDLQTGQGTLDPNIESSDLIYFLFNKGLDEGDFEDAAALFARSLLNGGGNGGNGSIPEPASAVLLGLGAMAMLRRTRAQA